LRRDNRDSSLISVERKETILLHKEGTKSSTRYFAGKRMKRQLGIHETNQKTQARQVKRDQKG
jgi:hypothetical protein